MPVTLGSPAPAGMARRVGPGSGLSHLSISSVGIKRINRAQKWSELIVQLPGTGFCGAQEWRAGPGSLVFLPRAIPHGIQILPAPQ